MKQDNRPINNTIVLFLTASLSIISFCTDDIMASPDSNSFRCALGQAFLAKAELSFLKGQNNLGKVYLAAAFESDPGIGQLKIKAMDMMHSDFPYVEYVEPHYSHGPYAVSDNQKFVFYRSGNNIVRLDLITFETKSVSIRESTIKLFNINASANGKYAVVSDNLGNMELIDVESEKIVGKFSFRKEKPESLSSIKMSFSPDATTIAAYYKNSDEPGLYFLNTSDLSLIKIEPVKGPVSPIRYLKNNELMLGINGNIKIVNPSTMDQIKTIAPETGLDADYLPQKNLIAVGKYESIKIYNTETLQKVNEFHGAAHNNVLVRFLADGRYLVYASPKRESGIIDCKSGKVIQKFPFGRRAAVSTYRYVLFTEEKIIELDKLRPYSEKIKYKTKTRLKAPYAVQKALNFTAAEAMSRTGGIITATAKGQKGDLEAFATDDGRIFIYDNLRAEKENFDGDYYTLTSEVKLLTSDRYRRTVDIEFIDNDAYLLRLAVLGNGQRGCVESYCIKSGQLKIIELFDPPTKVQIAHDLNCIFILDCQNRVLLSKIPLLEPTIELLADSEEKRDIYVDNDFNKLVVRTADRIDSYDIDRLKKTSGILSFHQAAERFNISLENVDKDLWDLFNQLSGELLSRDDFPADLQDVLDKKSEELKTSGGVFIAGRVTMSDGAPISSGKDVMVNLYHGIDEPFRIYKDGWFMLDSVLPSHYGGERGKLVLRAFGYEPDDVSVTILKGQITYLQFTMRKLPDEYLATVKGVVVNDHNEPFEGAEVSLSFPFANYGINNSPYRSYVTGKDGKFSFEGLSSAEYSLVASAPGYAYHYLNFTPAPGETIKKELKLYPNSCIVIDYVYQADGSSTFTDGDSQEGTIEWTVGEGGIDFSDAKVEKYEPDSPRDIELRQDQNNLEFRVFYCRGRNGFYDAGDVDFESVEEVAEDGYHTTKKPCVIGHTYIVRTYEDKYAKFIVRRIFRAKKTSH